MNIIVTGASRGIGYELVKLFSAGKHTVIALARNEQKLNQLQKECLLNNSNARVITLVMDLQEEGSLDKLKGAIAQTEGSIDVLINNAGALVNKPFMELTLSDFNKAYSVNVFSAARIIQAVLPHLNTTVRAHVVNISSIGGFQGSVKFGGLSAYSSSKAAIACLTECLAEEYKDSRISFNCLALGAVQTEMLEEAFPGYQAPVSGGQMAAYIADFALNAQHYLNGKIIPVSMSTP